MLCQKTESDIRQNLSLPFSDGVYRVEKYIIPGDPVPLARPRWGNGHVYDSQSLLKMKASRILEELHGTKDKFIGPIHMDITFFMCLPKVGIKKMQEVNGKYHICRPDFSNLLKFCEDIAQPILYHDDCIIASICGCKKYDLTPRTELIITQLDPKLARKER